MKTISSEDITIPEAYNPSNLIQSLKEKLNDDGNSIGMMKREIYLSIITMLLYQKFSEDEAEAIQLFKEKEFTAMNDLADLKSGSLWLTASNIAQVAFPLLKGASALAPAPFKMLADILGMEGDNAVDKISDFLGSAENISNISTNAGSRHQQSLEVPAEFHKQTYGRTVSERQKKKTDAGSNISSTISRNDELLRTIRQILEAMARG